jgi:hypothetical protein
VPHSRSGTRRSHRPISPCCQPRIPILAPRTEPNTAACRRLSAQVKAVIPSRRLPVNRDISAEMASPSGLAEAAVKFDKCAGTRLINIHRGHNRRSPDKPEAERRRRPAIPQSPARQAPSAPAGPAWEHQRVALAHGGERLLKAGSPAVAYVRAAHGYCRLMNAPPARRSSDWAWARSTPSESRNTCCRRRTRCYRRSTTRNPRSGSGAKRERRACQLIWIVVRPIVAVRPSAPSASSVSL